MVVLMQGAVSAIAFPNHIQQLMKDFTGRSWVFDEITCWLQQKDQRFFLLTGEPGVGKSAISDRLSQFSSSTESLHPNLLPGFLNAVHHCSARDSTTVDPKKFAHCTGDRSATGSHP